MVEILLGADRYFTTEVQKGGEGDSPNIFSVSAMDCVVKTLMHPNEVSGQILDASIAVHRALGPGLLESAYEACLFYELRKREMNCAAQVVLPVFYDDQKIDAGYRLDLIVEDTVIIEIKAVEAIAPIHKAQILTYLKLSQKPIGLLINFNVLRLKDGFQRFVL